MIFSFEELRRFYFKINSLGETVLFNEFNGGKKFLIRHDIDFDLNCALKLAEIENEMGIVSTFFVLVRTDNYNIFSSKSSKILNLIKGLGHEIGLHFDASFYNDNFNYYAEKEATILSDLIDKEVKSIALHNPSINNLYPEFPSFNDAYSKKYFNPDFYLSDACFDFRGKNCSDFVENIKYDSLQISLHPEHYTKNGLKNYVPIFNQIFQNRLNEFDKSMMRNKTYKKNRKSVGYSIKIL